MRKYFLMAIGIIIAFAVVGYFIWRVIATLFQMYTDRQLFKEMDEIQRESEQRREKKRAENEERLATGCDHDFENDRFGALPADVCGKCGMPRQKPNGPCDHIWQVVEGPTPASVCQKCAKRYSPLDATHSSQP